MALGLRIGKPYFHLLTSVELERVEMDSYGFGSKDR
jgi:hypothetical protein